MEPINPRARFRLPVISIVVALTAFAGGIAAARWREPTVVVVAVPVASPAPSPVTVIRQVPIFCGYPYTWRSASFDLRPWCGWD
jgi:hypothetical protein